MRSYKTIPVAQAANPDYELLDFQEVAMSSDLLELDIANCSEIKSIDKLKNMKRLQDIKISNLSKENKEIILSLPNIKYISTNTIQKISKEELKFMEFNK